MIEISMLKGIEGSECEDCLVKELGKILNNDKEAKFISNPIEVNKAKKLRKKLQEKGVKKYWECKVYKEQWSKAFNANKFTKEFGREFGIKHNGIGDMYLDIANVSNWDNETCGKPSFLGEIKIFEPKCDANKGRYYPWTYNYCDKYDEKFNFLSKFDNRIYCTNADEGQILYDLIKMIVCADKTSESAVKLQQVISINKTAPDNACPSNYELSEDYIINNNIKIVSLFNQFSKNDNNQLAIYNFDKKEANGTPSLLLNTKKAYSITGRQEICLSKCNKYFHVLFTWEYESVKKSNNLVLR